jgi:hypothetical protein
MLYMGDPAKRHYSLTEVEEKYPQVYAGELRRHEDLLNQFFRMYSKMFDLYLFLFRKEGSERNKYNNNQRCFIAHRRPRS